MSTGIELIAAERERQVEVLGWTSEHDLEHDQQELAWAAVHYAAPDPEAYVTPEVRKTNYAKEGTYDPVFPESWDPEWDKKGRDGRIRDLVKAGALAAAEIDRLKAEEMAAPFPAKAIVAGAKSIREAEDKRVLSLLDTMDLDRLDGSWSPLDVDTVIERLNEILATDPAALSALVDGRTPCSVELAHHPTVQVQGYESGVFTVGLLGILNGLFGVDKEGWGPIAACYEDDHPGRIDRFERSDAEGITRNPGKTKG